MVRVYTVNCPFNIHQDLEEQLVDAGKTLSEIGAEYADSPWLCVAYLGGRRFYPTRDEWGDIILADGDVVYWFPHVGGLEFLATVVFAGFTVGELIIGGLLLWGAYEAFSALVPSVGQIDDLPEPEPVWGLTGQRNQNRLGHSIQDGYGRLKLWPTYAARPYSQYYDNDQYQFQLLCLGHGSWDVEDVFIEDTDISNFQDTTYSIYKPGETVALFPDNVETSVEVGAIELFGPNEDDYPENDPGSGDDGFYTYTANSASTTANKLEVDVVFPQGLYYGNNAGGLDARNIDLEFEYREIDDAGDPVGSWTDFSPTTFSKSLATNTPQRFTIEQTVTAGRYEVRGRRTNNKDDSHRAGNTAIWAGLRAFRVEDRDYGDVTLLAVKARATSNLNDNSANRVNVIATRELPDYDDGANTLAAVGDYGNRTATRNPIWAAVNILRAEWGAGLTDEFLDLEFLGDEAAIADTDQVYFDHVFDSRMTVWDAIKACLFPFKATPILKGSLWTVVRDKPSTSPTFFLNPENTIAGTFKLNRKLYTIREHDGLVIEYLDDTTWKLETVECLLPGDAGSNPKAIKLPGVTNRAKVYDLGMYLWTRESKERQQIVVQTGLEGYIPTFNDLGRFGSDVTRWATNGYVMAIDGDDVTLSEDVTFEVGESYQIALRNKHGEPTGPHAVTAGTEANQVVCPGLPSGEFFFDEQNEPPYFMFGKVDEVGKIGRVLTVKPVGDGSVEITAIVDDQSRFDEPAESVDDLPTDNTPAPPPPAPIATGLQAYDSVSPGFILLRWDAVAGARAYNVETSSDGVDWAHLTQTPLTSFAFRGTPGLYHIRVAAENVGLGPWNTWTGTLGDNASAVGLVSHNVTMTETVSASKYGRFLITSAGITLTLSEKIGNQVISVANTSNGDVYLDFDIELRGNVTTSPVTMRSGEVFELIYDENLDLWRF